ncbi:hypothetical protein CRE_19911 [Caenorhabditis remanei]|uniref:Uncharacterized protein n=1 Tax=Caenorhabditis remanei TaxID=31234 RepID=E3N2Y2_CAERE|nr:hypothetical protein CRE_19911 [Caenorhabditis remanei]
MSSLRQSSATSPTSPVARNVYSRASVDVESGEIQQNSHSNNHNSHKRPYTPGASPREILHAQQSLRQLPSPSQTSPHGSRFMDGYRRRMRQASLNLPSESQLLDEDLGFPPVCSPPPEVFCGSISGNQMRNRSNSEVVRMRSSHSLGNGGLLVFFPTSPSSSSNNSGCRYGIHRRICKITQETTGFECVSILLRSTDIIERTGRSPSPPPPPRSPISMATVSTSTSSTANLIFPPIPAPDPFSQYQRSPTPSALLVFLAATPTSEDDAPGAISPRRKWSSQKEDRGTRSAPCSARRVEKSISLDGDQAIDRFFLSHRTSLSTIEQEPECCSGSAVEQDHPSPLPSKGLIRKFRKRILSIDKAYSAPACSSTCNGSCTVENWLKLAEHIFKKKLGKVMAAPWRYVNGHITLEREQHQESNYLAQTIRVHHHHQVQILVHIMLIVLFRLQLSSSPLCSPQSVAARASASCDSQQSGLPSPGRRQTMSGRVHRASFTAGGTLKSFDSGLDLSSPTINHTALLIKE